MYWNTKESDKTNHRLVCQLELVQRRATRWETGRYHNTSSVSDMLLSLDWRSPEQRRVYSRLTTLYKIRNYLVAMDENHCLQRCTGWRENQYPQLRAHKNYTCFSFFPGQPYSGTSFQVKSAWQSCSIPSRPRLRRSSTPDSPSCRFIPVLLLEGLNDVSFWW